MITAIKQHFYILTLISAIPFLGGCALSNVQPDFKFSDQEPDAALLAFSVRCVGVKSLIDTEVINVDTSAKYYFRFNCDKEISYSQIQILKIPEGHYMFGSVDYDIGNVRHYIEGKNHFFPVLAHKLNYIGRIAYDIDLYFINTSVYNESTVDLPQIKLAVPEISQQDYITLIWEKDFDGKYNAKYKLENEI